MDEVRLRLERKFIQEKNEKITELAWLSEKLSKQAPKLRIDDSAAIAAVRTTVPAW
jgi:hypothetical protein